MLLCHDHKKGPIMKKLIAVACFFALSSCGKLNPFAKKNKIECVDLVKGRFLRQAAGFFRRQIYKAHNKIKAQF